MPAVQKGRHRLPYTFKLGTQTRAEKADFLTFESAKSAFSPALAGGARVCVQKDIEAIRFS